MTILTLPLGALQTNCYVVGNAAGDAYLIDPGGEADLLLGKLRQAGLRASAILLTHAHIDHIGAVPEAAAALGLPVLLDPAEDPLYRSPANGLPPWVPALKGPLPATVPALAEPLPDLAFEILRTPGHTRGGISFHFPSLQAVFSGDALFQGSVGRTDLPGGDWETLRRSIVEVLFALPDETTVYPGHGPPTTIGDEKRFNPYL